MLENTVRQKYLYCKQSCSSCSVFKRNTKGWDLDYFPL
jgi:hypothetical protein